jgi:hypothetical protein
MNTNEPDEAQINGHKHHLPATAGRLDRAVHLARLCSRLADAELMKANINYWIKTGDIERATAQADAARRRMAHWAGRAVRLLEHAQRLANTQQPEPVSKPESERRPA